MMHPFTSIPDAASQYKVIQTKFPSNATVQKALGPNPQRVALFVCDSAGSINFGVDDSKPDNSAGLFQLSAQPSNGFFYFALHGPVLGQAWYTCRASGVSTTYFTEIIYVPS